MNQHSLPDRSATSAPATPDAVDDKAPPTIGDDLLCGAAEIARFVFGSAEHRRKVYYLTGDAAVRMPHFKLGSVLCARKSTLLAWIERQEARQ